MARLAIAITVIATALAFAASALATHLPTTGEPIRLLNPAAAPTTFPANTPFFVRHGWVCLPHERADCLDPTTEFRLYVDGRRMPSALDMHLNLKCGMAGIDSDECIAKGNHTNFRFGLPAGPHAFRGEWPLHGEVAVLREATIEFVG